MKSRRLMVASQSGAFKKFARPNEMSPARRMRIACAPSPIVRIV
jgi:hypothetical protein